MMRKARKSAVAHQDTGAARPAAHRLTRHQTQCFLALMPGWPGDCATGALQAPGGEADELDDLDELVEATRRLCLQRCVLRVSGLSEGRTRYMAERTPTIIRPVLVDPLGNSQQVIRVHRTA